MAEAPSLLALAPDSVGNLVTLLTLDDRARLAATCRQCRTAEQEDDANVRSRAHRVDHLVGVARTWLESGIDPNTIRRGEDNAFKRVMRELDGAGRWGAPGILRIVPLVAPRCHKSPPISSDAQYVRIRCRPYFRPLAIRWLPTLDAEKLAREAAHRLVVAGTQALDVKMTLHPETNDAKACQRECDDIFLLGLLGRATVPHLPTLIGKLLPELSSEEEAEGLWDEFWGDCLLGECFEHRDEVCIVGNIVLDSLELLTPSMSDSDVVLLANILGQHIRDRKQLDQFNHGEQLCIAAILALSKLGSRLGDHCVINAVIGIFPFSALDGGTLDAAVCRFIGAVGLPQHLDYPLKGMRIEASVVSYEAANTLRLLSPMLDRTQHARMVEEVINIASGDGQTVDGACDLLADLAKNSYGRTIDHTTMYGRTIAGTID